MSLERKLKKELKREQKSNFSSPEKKSETSGQNDFMSAGPRERLKILLSRSKEKTGTKEEESVDLSLEENEVYLESPLPTTMTVDLFPIEKIQNGTIYTEDNRYLKIIEVMPINFLLKSDEEQESVISDFERFLKVAPETLQIKTLAKRTDISRYLSKIDEDIAHEKDENCKKMMQDTKQLIQSVGATESVSRRFFMVFQYKKVIGRSISEEEIENHLNVMKGRAVNYLAQCGNSVLIMENNTNETAMIYFDIYNRTKSSSIDFPKRIQQVYAYYDMTYGEEATKMIPVKEYLVPSEIDLTHPDYLRMDNTYYTFLYLRGNGYPTEVPKGWISAIVNAGEGIDMDMFIQKESREKMQERIGRKLRWTTSKMNNLSDSTTEYDDLNDIMASGYYLKRNLAGGAQDFYYVGIMITITAQSLSALKQKKSEMISLLKSYELFTGNCDYEMKRALSSYSLLGKMDTKIWKRAKQNVLTHDLSSFYPFGSFEMCDEDGIFLGTNEINNSLCLTDIFNTKNYKNANMAIMGTTGAGKTFLLQLLATRMRQKGIQTFIIAPNKGHEFKRASENIGGSYIKISEASTDCINIMEIRQRDDTANTLLDGEDTDSLLALKIQSLHIFFSLLISDITTEEDEILDEVFVLVYKHYGITDDNESLIDPEHPDQYKKMPILEDVYHELLQKGDRAKRVATILNRLVNGSAKTFNQRTNVELDNLYTVIDISKLSGNLLLAGMFIAIDFVYSKAKEDRTKKKAIFIDELWELIGVKSNLKAASYIVEIFKIIRGYGGAAICATQDLNDFFALDDGRFGKGIINNCKTKIVLNMEQEEAKAVQKLLNLSKEEYKKILNFARGHGLLCTNGNTLSIDFKSSEREKALITTDRAELEKLLHEKRTA